MIFTLQERNKKVGGGKSIHSFRSVSSGFRTATVRFILSPILSLPCRVEAEKIGASRFLYSMAVWRIALSPKKKSRLFIFQRIQFAEVATKANIKKEVKAWEVCIHVHWSGISLCQLQFFGSSIEIKPEKNLLFPIPFVKRAKKSPKKEKDGETYFFFAKLRFSLKGKMKR